MWSSVERSSFAPQAEVFWLMATKEMWLAGDVCAARELLERELGEEQEGRQGAAQDLAPLFLHHVKSEVEKGLLLKKEINIYIGLTDKQQKWHCSVLENDNDGVNGLTGRKEGKTQNTAHENGHAAS